MQPGCILGRMGRFAHSGPDSHLGGRSFETPTAYPHIVPFGPLGGGQWTGHPVGLLIVFGFILIALVGVRESRWFFLGSLGLSVILGSGLYLWHRSKSFF